MKTTIARPDLSIAPVESPASTPSAGQVDLSYNAGQAGGSQLAGFNGANGFDADRRRGHSFEEARRNHVQLNGLMARVRKPLPRMTERMARAGLRAGSAGTMRGDYAYRGIFKPTDGKDYEMQVHPVKNLLEWNFTNLHADLFMQPYLYGSREFSGNHALMYGQPWQPLLPGQAAAGHDGHPQLHVLPGAAPAMQAASGFQYAALRFSPFRQGQFQYPAFDHTHPGHQAPQRSGSRAIRRRTTAQFDPAADDDSLIAEPHAMSMRRNAGQWGEVVGQLHDAGMTAADMREWINDFHDCRRYPCAENHAQFNEKYGGLFNGDIGDEKLRAAFDGLRRAFGAALAPGKADPVPLPMIHVIPV
ncbi:MAG: hypothetical protein H7234_03950 [Herminiimonas sp.]|nr:hypothetical protein [Herminiimonas sp.]